jgi:hypothetical protein
MPSHAVVRAKERYGIDVGPRWFFKVLQDIRENRAKLVNVLYCHTPGARTYDVADPARMNEVIRVVVDKEIEHVITVLPMVSAVERHKQFRDKRCKQRQRIFRELRHGEGDDDE